MKQITDSRCWSFLATMLLLAGTVVASPASAQGEVTPSERVTRNVVVRAGPSTSSARLGALQPGDEAELIGEVPGWYQVRLQDGRVGFVSKTWTVVRSDGEPQPLALASGPLKLHVIDVGTGLSIFIEGPGFTMIYDGGSQDDLAMGNENRLLAYIQAVRPDVSTIDHLVLSHPHKDHLELLPDVFRKFSVRHVWDSGAVNKTRGYCRFLKAVEDEPGAQYHNAIATGGTHRVTFSGKSCSGEIVLPQAQMMSAAPVQLGGATTMSILYRDASPRHDPNENTVVIRLDHARRRILIAGDAEGGERLPPGSLPSRGSIEGNLLENSRADVAADVLVVGHHGSLTSSRRAFLDAVDATIFVISSGPHPYSKKVLPDPEIEAELATRGRVLQTDLDDDACELVDRQKTGPDFDESPGGCDNVLVMIGTDGGIAADYNRIAD